ncbi:hypothetical protein [Mitsuokella sp. AF21-1AC]|uniref:hypothetical protein n=1 Tax=Mitsuokella sp. AF21-1AC TaxID=2292235 RepID=UPI000E468FA4|nr:hypothetical protein [Mitsuokella sp. AF21-1AC]RGS72035.1 hypothetical protein DWX75_07505 [Mitsuokella sp. AF21-1AC]
MKELTLVFDSVLFEWPRREDTRKRIAAMESKINDFLRGVEAIGVAYGVYIHLDWRYDHFKAGLKVKYINWFSLKVIHADDDLRPHEAFSVIIHARDTLKFKKNKTGDLVSIELIKATEE